MTGTPTPLPPALLRRADDQAGLVSARQCDAAGVGRQRLVRLVRAGGAVRVARGVLDLTPSLPPPDVTVDAHATRRRRAAWAGLLAYGEGRAVAVGLCALALYGVEGLPMTIAPEVALPGAEHRRPRGGMRVRCFDVDARIVLLGGARVVDPVAALAQAVCELPRRRVLAVVDSAVQLRLLPADALVAVRTVAAGRRGAAALDSWWHLVDGRAQSAPETWARLECVDAGVAPHDVQVPVRDVTGRVVARGDLGWWRHDGRLLVVEIDGRGPHSTPQALFRDRARQNAIAATARTDLLRFTLADLGTGRLPSAVARWLAAPSPAGP